MTFTGISLADVGPDPSSAASKPCDLESLSKVRGDDTVSALSVPGIGLGFFCLQEGESGRIRICTEAVWPHNPGLRLSEPSSLSWTNEDQDSTFLPQLLRGSEITPRRYQLTKYLINCSHCTGWFKELFLL